MAEQEMFDKNKNEDSKEPAENEKFVRANGEILTNKQAIQSCRQEQNRDIIDNLRLGSYDRFGNYIIVPAIRQELLIIPKLVYVKQKQKDKTIFDMKSTIPLFGDIFFKLVASKEEVTLYLVETVRREAGDYVEVYEEMLDNFAMTEDDYVPLSVIFKNYNIYEEDDGDYGKSIFNAYDFANILTRKIYLSLLSKELLEIADFDDKQGFEEMVAILKESGEYGERVLAVFEERVKDRPEIYEISSSKQYNKAVLEVLLSAVDIATTQADKDNFETRETYFKLLNVRNKNIDKYIAQANKNIDEEYVSNIVTRATKHFLQDEDETEDEVLLEFMDKISPSKKRTEKRTLAAPILKQGLQERKEAERLAAIVASADKKEEAIKQILAAKKPAQKPATPANKKLKPAKKAVKKKVAKKKAAKPKKKVKAKVKTKKPVKKAQNVKKAVAKTGKKLKPAKKSAKKAAKKGKKKAKKNEYEVTFSRGFLEKYRAALSSKSQATQHATSQAAAPSSQAKIIAEKIIKDRPAPQKTTYAKSRVSTTPEKKENKLGSQANSKDHVEENSFLDDLFGGRTGTQNGASNNNISMQNMTENKDEISQQDDKFVIKPQQNATATGDKATEHFADAKEQPDKQQPNTEMNNQSEKTPPRFQGFSRQNASTQQTSRTTPSSASQTHDEQSFS